MLGSCRAGAIWAVSFERSGLGAESHETCKDADPSRRSDGPFHPSRGGPANNKGDEGLQGQDKAEESWPELLAQQATQMSAGVRDESVKLTAVAICGRVTARSASRPALRSARLRTLAAPW